MVAETLTSTRAVATFPAYTPGGAGDMACAYGTYEIAAVVEDGDIFEMCKLPPGATVVGGAIYADDIDTGTETLDMDVGWAANGVDSASPAGFGNLGVWSGDAVVGIKPETVNFFPLIGVLKDGPKTFGAAETTIQIEANAASNAGHVGTITCVVYYITP